MWFSSPYLLNRLPTLFHHFIFVAFSHLSRLRSPSSSRSSLLSLLSTFIILHLCLPSRQIDTLSLLRKVTLLSISLFLCSFVSSWWRRNKETLLFILLLLLFLFLFLIVTIRGWLLFSTIDLLTYSTGGLWYQTFISIADTP